MPVPHPNPLSQASYSAAELVPENDAVLLLDQRQLPQKELYLRFHEAAAVALAITEMIVRGAPAIGIAAAYGLAVEAYRLQSKDSVAFTKQFSDAATVMANARPTAVNLRWAVDQMTHDLPQIAALSGAARVEKLAERARQIHRDDVAACRAMGKLGAEYIPRGATILTHCNAGALATGGFGTALGVIRAAHEAGKNIKVLSCETRPYLQGARLTVWELLADKIPVELICDNMAGYYFSRAEIDCVVVGADRIARNGDVANKIGTYSHACLAHLHERPFYVAAPTSTLDPNCESGVQIPIENRSSLEVVQVGSTRIAPADAIARHPGFDVTPYKYISKIFTEKGTFEPNS